jgi:hypothetical protein
VNRHGPLTEAAVWRLAAGLADALRAVHGCGLVHRDLKPGNVLLAADGPHVIDFGISRAFEGTALTSAGMVVGTPGYMSPEQAEGQQAGPPSDVFSLGCVLVYAATGNAPFGGGSAASILYRVVTAEPDLAAIPASLRQVIAACLGKNPAQRVGLAQLASMISALGPPLPTAIGAFWPEPLAGIIAADQAPHPATEVSGTPVRPPAVSPPAGGPALGGPVHGGPVHGGPALGAPALGAPALGGPALGGPALGGRTWAGSPVQAGQPQGNQGMAPAARIQQGPAPAPTGHAPMVADGYYAAAAGNVGSGSVSPGSASAQPPYGQPAAGQPAPGQSWPPQYPGQQYPSGQQPASWPQPPAWQGADAVSRQAAVPQVVAPQAAAPGTQYGTPSWPQPDGPAGPAAGSAPATLQATSWPPQQQQPSSGGSWPGGGPPSGSGGSSYPGAGTPLAQYAPGRRRPTKAELPPPVLGAARLMYLGAAVTALNVLFGSLVKVRYNDDAAGNTGRADKYTTAAAAHPGTILGKRYGAIAKSATEAAKHASTMAGDIGLVVGLGGLVGVVCWLVIAAACRRGRGWTRTAATALLGLDTAGLLIVLLGTDNDPTVRVTTVIIWIIGLAATIPLWGRQARDFFAYYRR